MDLCYRGGKKTLLVINRNIQVLSPDVGTQLLDSRLAGVPFLTFLHML